MEDKEKEILDDVQAQISSFDNKASILLSVVGIIFALTLSFLDVFHAEYFIARNKSFRILYTVTFIMYILTTISIIISLLFVILPRKHKSLINYPNYFADVNMMNKDELIEKIKMYNNDSNMIVDQIRINSKICSAKQKWLKLGMYLFVPFVLFIVVMIFMIIFA